MRLRLILISIVALALPSSAVRAQPADIARPFATEAAWVEHDIVEALRAMPGAKARLLLRREPFVREPSRHIWDPDGYLPLLKRSPARVVRPSSGELIGLLTTPAIGTLERVNLETSARVREEPSAPEPHDDAALLLGIVAMRESAGRFSDTRPALARMTAHLAMSKALGGSPLAQNRRAAELLLLVLVSRQAEAMQQIDAWTRESPTDGIPRFLTAMRLRVTGNWKQIGEPNSLTLLERIAYTQALMARMGTGAVLDFIGESHPEPVADWTRIVASGAITVESGHVLAKVALDDELREAAVVWPADADSLTRPALVNALTRGPDTDLPGSEYRVIDWPFWRATIQRHLANKISVIVMHSDQLLASRKTASLAEGLDLEFGSMPLYPLVRRGYAFDNAHYEAAMAGGRRLLAEHPEWVTPANWTLLAQRWRSAPPPDNVPPTPVWFAPLVPEQTAYDTANRVSGVRGVLLARPHELRAMRSLAPFDRQVMLWLTTFELGERPPLDRLEAAFGEATAYDRELLYRLTYASWDDDTAFRRFGDRLCDSSPDECGWVADGLLDSGHLEEAAAYYRLFAERARDRVGVTHKIRWLVMRDLDEGRVAEAKALADESEAINSGPGLLTKALFLEERGQLIEAEALLRKEIERYGREPAPLVAFYLRQMTSVAARRMYDPVAQPLIAKLFPRGLEAFVPTADTDAPDSGVRVQKAGRTGERIGIFANDVIVSVNGIRVSNTTQLSVLRDAHAGRDFSAWVYRAGQYVEVRRLPRFGWVNAQFADYRAPVGVGSDAQGLIRLPWAP